MKSSSRICVAVRKRPPGSDDKDVVNCKGETSSLIVNEPKIKYDLTPYTDKHNFMFDEVFDERANNRLVYIKAAAPLVEHIFSAPAAAGAGGKKASSADAPTATVFCYGQTGSGKSWTMLGNSGEPGLYLCAAHDVFVRAQRQQSYSVFVSFYEIYGRKLFDLLNDRAKLVCREDGDKVIQICGLTEHPVATVEQLVGVIDAGTQLRAAGQTSANAESSRSHAVLLMEVRDMRDQRPVGKISFIDLAGNERGSDTFDCDRKTRLEGAEINKSLLALKECIRALGMGKSHVPFRGSILTEVLRDSFLGNSRTTMIATISAVAQHCEHTLNTLRYTSRVKELGPSAKAAKKEAAAAAAAVNSAAAGAASEPSQQSAAAAPRQPDSKAAQRAAAMAERVAMDAAGMEPVPSRISGNRNSGGGGGSNSGNNSNNNANKPVPKQGRRAVQPSAPEKKPAVPSRSNSNVGGAAAARAAARHERHKVNLDPVVQTIVEQHISNIDELDAEAGADSSDSDADGDDQQQQPLELDQLQRDDPRQSLSSSYRKVRAVHAHIVSRIRASEESVMMMHRRHVDHKMAMMKSEVQHLQELDDSSSIDEYVDKVDALLEREVREITGMRERLAQIQRYLKEEEVLSKTLTPAGKRQRPQ